MGSNPMGSNFEDYIELRCTDCGRPMGYIYRNAVSTGTCRTAVCLVCAAKT